jgi:hypothetical protein
MKQSIRDRIDDLRAWLNAQSHSGGAVRVLEEIAASHADLLVACKKLLAISLPHDVSGQRMRDEAIAAIADAEGRS